MPTPPVLSNEQRRQAYELALKLRRQRARIKLQLAEGAWTFEEAWDLDQAQGMKVLDLVAALPRIGRPTAIKLLEQAGFKHPEKTTVRATGPRQREKLFQLLAETSASVGSETIQQCCEERRRT